MFSVQQSDENNSMDLKQRSFTKAHNPKSSLSFRAGLTVRTNSTTNTPYKDLEAKKEKKSNIRVQASSKFTGSHKTKYDVEDEKEYMPTVIPERDNYEDIIPFDEQPSAEILTRILSVPIMEVSDDEDEYSIIPKLPCFANPFECELLEPELITDDFEPCSLDSSDFNDDSFS